VVGATLTVKLVRDLRRSLGQIAAIAAIVTCGIAVLVMMSSNYESLRLTQSAYYTRTAFADVFASLSRAPESVAKRIAAVPGVEAVETRVVVPVTLDLPERVEAVSALFVSVPDGVEPGVNRLVLRDGRMVREGASDEVLVSEAFGRANGLHPGASVAAVINGRRQLLRVVGVALSPEYVYEIGPGALFPDSRRFGIMWMGRRSLAAAYDMTGAFNDLALRIAPGTVVGTDRAAIDRVLERYGGQGAIARADQASNWFLTNELTELRTQGIIIPLVFLAIATFLTNALLARIVATERVQIGALKAFGYSSARIAWHYVAFALVIVLLGGIAGTVFGVWFGQALAHLYEEFFRFPTLEYHVSPLIVGGALAVCAASGVLGALGSANASARLAPAEAMRAEGPLRYRPTVIERLGLGRWLPTTWRMVLRNLERRPLRSIATVAGNASATALLIVGIASLDSVSAMLDVQFRMLQHEDVAVGFIRPRAARSLYEARHLPGVLRAESFRVVSARLWNGTRSYRLGVTGMERGATLRRLLDSGNRAVALPAAGILVSATLAQILNVKVGDSIDVQVLEGRRDRFSVAVQGLVDEPIGLSATMELGELQRRIGEATISGVYLAIDPREGRRLDAALKRTPQVSSVMYRKGRRRSGAASR
jgi:putative ABC transport system permease protein